MASFVQFLQSKTNSNMDAWFVYGRNSVLIHSCVRKVRDYFSDHTNVVVVSGGELTLSFIAEVLTDSLPGEKTIFVVDDALSFVAWDDIKDCFGKLADVVFLAYTEEVVEKDDIPKFFASTKARTVVCGDLKDEDWALWVEGSIDIEPEAARFLQKRSFCDYSWMQTQINNLSAIGVRVTTNIVERLCTTTGKPSFGESLIHVRKPVSVKRVEYGVNRSTFYEIRDALVDRSRLSSKLTTIGFSPTKIQNSLYMNKKQFEQYRRSALRYDKPVSTRNFAALHKLQEGLLNGNEHAFYALITRW